ncbi:MAG: hypothetical protein ACI9XJ_002643, partial [Marivirga sp.]
VITLVRIVVSVVANDVDLDDLLSFVILLGNTDDAFTIAC